MKRIDREYIKEIKKYGAFDISACFNCGNCTAVCPLSKQDASFPRNIIRLANLGEKKEVLSKKELWMCYYCGECSETCPRQAEPGEFMASARRYAIAKNDITGITPFLYKSGIFNFLFMSALALFFAFFMYANRAEKSGEEKIIEIFHIPFHLVHDMGVIIMAIAGMALIIGMLKMAVATAGIKNIFTMIFKLPLGAFKAVFDTAAGEMLAFKRYRDCDSENEEKKSVPLLLKPWFLHASVAWGFMMLFLATIIDFLFKDPELSVALWYPPRLIGTIGGILLMYGSSVLIGKRIAKTEKKYEKTTFSDWWFLVILWFIGLTGFILEILVYLPEVNKNTADILFLIHVAPAMELVVLAAYTKLAHVFYRPLALFIYNLKSQISDQKSQITDNNKKKAGDNA